MTIVVLKDGSMKRDSTASQPPATSVKASSAASGFSKHVTTAVPDNLASMIKDGAFVVSVGPENPLVDPTNLKR